MVRGFNLRRVYDALILKKCSYETRYAVTISVHENFHLCRSPVIVWPFGEASPFSIFGRGFCMIIFRFGAF